MDAATVRVDVEYRRTESGLQTMDPYYPPRCRPERGCRPSFSCLDQFFCMAFAQLRYRESLRDIEACLRAASEAAERTARG